MGRSSFVGRIFTGALSAIMVMGVVLSQSATVAASNGRAAQKPDVGRAVGPWVMTGSLKALPHIPDNPNTRVLRLTNHPQRVAGAQQDASSAQYRSISRPLPDGRVNTNPQPDMPSPLTTFPGMSLADGCGNCLPPDPQGDVGPDNYVQSVNTAIRIHDKAGNVLAGPITYNSFFSPMGSATPCGSNANQGDGQVMYDHISDRWVVTDFAFPSFPGTSFFQCIGVSRTADPVAGGWYLYAVQIDPANPTFLGDYAKIALWPDAYYLSVNLFSSSATFNGVRVFALDRAAMVNGSAATTIAFTIAPADLGNQYSLLPATFRTGDAPPAGQPEWFMNVNSSAVAGTIENQVFVRRFHADFATPVNSYFGAGATHAPDGTVTVNGFKDAFRTTSSKIVPNGTVTATQWLDTLGDKLMVPLVYQNLGGVESLYASQTILLASDATLTGPTAVRWYQFNVTGNAIPATPAQQQDFNNGNDGLFRWMPSINVDVQGNVAIGYSASSTTVDPGIRYAGRLAGDPANTLAQGEAVMTLGTGHQTSTSGRWGDYTSTFVDPSDGCTFYHTNEYYSATASFSWNTRVGRFRMPGCGSPTEIASIAVTPVDPSVAKGRTQQFTATATYTDSSQGDVTNSVTWSSSNTGAATIDSSGLAITPGTGTTTIRATDPATSVYGETTLTVTAPALDSISVTPANPSILPGGTQQFTATGTYSDATTQDLTSSATWSSSNAAVATINSSGLASGLTPGTTTITATDSGSGVSGNTLLTVSTPPPPGDTTPPTVWNVNTFLREGGHIGSVSVTVSWSASDNVTPTNQLVFQIQRRRFRMHGPTAWQQVAMVTGETSLYQVPLWHRYQYRVRARDEAGNWSAWAQAFPITFIRRDERHFTRDASWTTTSVPGAMRGRVARSSTPGGTASLSFTGNGVALVATTGPGQGKVQVCIDPGTASQRCRTIDLSALAAGKKQLPVVFTVPWATHTLRATVIAGTVDLDGAIFSR